MEFESSYDPTGPFGAKSIGEIGINTLSPTIAHDVYNGIKVNVRSITITGEKIAMKMIDNEDEHYLESVIDKIYISFIINRYINK